MRKVNLNMNEKFKYEVIKKLVDTKGNKNSAAMKLSCTRRTIDRLIIRYKKFGKEGFVHRNYGRVPANKIPDHIVKDVQDLFENKYKDTNFRHYSELLLEYENISISDTSINSFMKKINVLSPKARRLTKKKMKQKLKKEMKMTKSISKKSSIQVEIDTLDRFDAHPRRPRCAYFGELIQMDASEHEWFGDIKTHLHLAIDDATGMVVGAYFDEQETLKAYYNVFFQILTEYGIPYKFLTDRRTVFEYKLKNAPSDEDDTFTQFSYACHQLGVEIDTTSIPQAKGRVERLNQTLQSRLIVEMRLKGITTIKEANKFLPEYFKNFNKKFSLPIHKRKTVFENKPTKTEINLTLAIIARRKIDAGHCVKYNKKFYIPALATGQHVFHNKSTPALIIEAFDGIKYVSIQDNIYHLSVIEDRLEFSKNFDKIGEEKPPKKYTPSMSHPWRQSSYESFLIKQPHRQNDGANV